MGKRANAKVLYHTSLPVIFGVKKYADALWEEVSSCHNSKLALFEAERCIIFFP